jgi:hypothetical protein
VKLGASRGMPDRLVPRTVSFDPKTRIFGNRLEVVLEGAPYRVFRFTLQGFKSIDCRPFTVIRDCLINWPYPLMAEFGEYYGLN